jgi:cyclin-A
MEKLILKVLSFDLGSASPLNFINLFSCMMEIPENVQCLAKYLCELSLLKADPFLKYKPSQVSTAALALSFHNFGLSIWSAKMRVSLDRFQFRV